MSYNSTSKTHVRNNVGKKYYDFLYEDLLGDKSKASSVPSTTRPPVKQQRSEEKETRWAYIYAGVGLTAIIAITGSIYYAVSKKTTKVNNEQQTITDKLIPVQLAEPKEQTTVWSNNTGSSLAKNQPPQSMSGGIHFGKKQPSVAEQADDVVRVLDGLDYLACQRRAEPKTRLVDAFLNYLKTVKAPDAEKARASEMISVVIMLELVGISIAYYRVFSLKK